MKLGRQKAEGRNWLLAVPGGLNGEAEAGRIRKMVSWLALTPTLSPMRGRPCRRSSPISMPLSQSPREFFVFKETRQVLRRSLIPTRWRLLSLSRGERVGVRASVTTDLSIFHQPQPIKNYEQPTIRGSLRRVAWFWIRALCSSPLVVCGQTTNDIPSLRPPHAEIPPTFWEQHTASVIGGSFLLLAIIGIAIWFATRPKPPVRNSMFL